MASKHNTLPFCHRLNAVLSSLTADRFSLHTWSYTDQLWSISLTELQEAVGSQWNERNQVRVKLSPAYPDIFSFKQLETGLLVY